MSELFAALQTKLSSGVTVLLGGGKSLTGFDFNQLNAPGVNVVAVKGSIFDLPWSAFGYGLDIPRLREWVPRLTAEVKMPVFWAVPFPVQKELQQIKPPCVTYIERRSEVGLSESPLLNFGGGSSGFGALGLAVALGARRIMLLGYDYGGSGVNVHHNDQHYARARNHDEESWKRWAEAFGVIAPRLTAKGVHVATVGNASGVNAFQKFGDYHAALAHLHRV